MPDAIEATGEMRVTSITVGERHRRAMGDIAALAASIRETGLLHPIVVSKSGELIAGARRLEACKQLGWTWVPARFIDLDDPLQAELDENVVRKDFTPSEIAAIAKVMREREEGAARERQGATQAKPGEQVGAAKFAEPVEDRGEVRGEPDPAPVQWQHPMLFDLSWAEFEAHLARLRKSVQRVSAELLIKEAIGNLHAQYPASATPLEAMRLAGIDPASFQLSDQHEIVA